MEAPDCIVVVSGDAVKAPGYTMVVPGDAVGISDHIVVVLDGTVEEQGRTGVAQDPPVAGVAQPGQRRRIR